MAKGESFYSHAHSISAQMARASSEVDDSPPRSGVSQRTVLGGHESGDDPGSARLRRRLENAQGYAGCKQAAEASDQARSRLRQRPARHERPIRVADVEAIQDGAHEKVHRRVGVKEGGKQ